MIERGKLVVLEGIDYAGKGTQLKLLEEKMLNRGVPYKLIDFPRYGHNHYAETVGRYLNGEFGNLESISPYLITYAYAGDRLLAKPLIEHSLDYGKLIITGRYVSSNKAYGAATLPQEGQEAFINWADDIEYSQNDMPEEDLVIYLKTPVNAAQKRMESDTSRLETDIHENNQSYQQKVADVYERLLEKSPHWRLIEAESERRLKTPAQINREIYELIRREGFLHKVDPLTIYFGCSIQGEKGGDEDKAMMVEVMKSLGHYVVSEVFLTKNPNLRHGRQLQKGQIYNTDKKWLLRQTDLVVADVSRKSIGVGMELGLGIDNDKRLIALCKSDRFENLTNMCIDNTEPNFTLYSWFSRDDLVKILKAELGEVKNG